MSLYQFTFSMEEDIAAFAAICTILSMFRDVRWGRESLRAS
jgi:hypothetical protein